MTKKGSGYARDNGNIGKICKDECTLGYLNRIVWEV
jgi:hypothetical protein